MNKTLYIHPRDVKVWEKAAQLLPYHFKLTVSQFCSAAIREVVERLEKGQLWTCPECSGVQIEEKPSERMMCRTCGHPMPHPMEPK
jgi:rubrerythrin